MKRLIAMLVPIMGTLLITQSALAAGPTLTRIPMDEESVDSSCGFDVDVHITGIVVDILWTTADGQVREIQAGTQAKWTLTNLETGKVITENLAGPSHFEANPDGSFTFVGTGTWGWGSNPESGEPGLFLTEGRFVYSGDSQGNVTFTIVGHIEDLCGELSA